MKNKILISLLFIISPFFVFAQETGGPFLKVFSPNSYLFEPQNWQITKDKRGLIYAANNAGLLEYDGTNWRRYFTDTKLNLRSVSVANNGIIFVGGDGEFGGFAPDEHGNLQYFNLSNLLDTSYTNSRLSVSDIVCRKDTTYFITQEHIFLYKNINPQKENKPKKIIDPKFVFYGVVQDGDNVYMKSGRVGIVQLAGDTVQMVKNGEAFQHIGVYGALNFDEKFLIVGANGLSFLNRFTDEDAPHTDSIYNFETQADSLFANRGIRGVIKISDSRVAIFLRKGGYVVLNQKGTVIEHVSHDTKIQADRVYSGIFDGKNIWTAMAKGIVSTEISSPFRFWDYDTGISASVNDMIRYKDTLYVADSHGIFYLTQKKDYTKGKTKGISELVKIGESSIRDCWAFYVDSINFDIPKLLVASSLGIFEIQKGKVIQLLDLKSTVYDITYSKEHPEILLLATHDGIVSLKVVGEKYQILGKFEEKRIGGRYIAEDKKGNIWYATGGSGIIKIKLFGKYPQKYSFDSIEVARYDTLSGLPQISENKVYYYKEGLVFLTTKGIKKFDYSKNRFVADNSFGKMYSDGSLGIFRFAPFENDIWLRVYNENNEWTEHLAMQDDGTFKRDTLPYKRLEKFNGNVLYYENNGILWTGGSEGIFQLNTKDNRSYIPVNKCLIRKVLFGRDSLLFGGNFYAGEKGYIKGREEKQPPNQQYKIDFKYNTLTFEYSLPSYEHQEAVTYSYFLEGYDKDNWSPWTTKTEKQYTNLPKGEYVFKVKAKNSFGLQSDMATYNFIILPPWYKTVFAYIFYILLGIAILYLSIKRYTRKLQREKEKLEEIVLERTAEILQQNEEIQAQADNLLMLNKDVTNKNVALIEQKNEIEQQNFLIRSSLKYAKTIQQAILPTEKVLSKYFNYFLIFKPKDIVSGDFYWCAHLPAANGFTEKKFIAAVDCTGHGVPGAFMSMIGNRLLNELINEKKITDPAIILENLNTGVIKALNQEVSENRDGMDISFCCFENLESGEVKITYAGAKRPLYIARKATGIVERIKGTHKSIGGILRTRSKASFENKIVIVYPGDMVYVSTDGYIDQNNEDRLRLGTSKFSKFVSEIAKLPLQEQKKAFENLLNSQMKDTKQRDDITLIGVRI